MTYVPYTCAVCASDADIHSPGIYTRCIITLQITLTHVLGRAHTITHSQLRAHKKYGPEERKEIYEINENPKISLICKIIFYFNFALKTKLENEESIVSHEINFSLKFSFYLVFEVQVLLIRYLIHNAFLIFKIINLAIKLVI